jgi:uncharacterized protein (TIGR02246 family)
MLRRHWCFSIALIASLSPARAEPSDECQTSAQRWAAAYSSNNLEKIVGAYSPDAILFGTNSPALAKGEAEIRKYFSRSPGSGNSVVIGSHQAVTLSESSAFVTGLYDFTIMRDGKPTPQPSRFTMVCANTGGDWRIVHHHSSILPAAR